MRSTSYNPLVKEIHDNAFSAHHLRMSAEDSEPQALREVLEGLAVSQRTPGAGATGSPAADEAHAFWDTQPVPRLGEDTSAMDPVLMGPMDSPIVGGIREEPYKLPPSFEWSDVDLADSEQAHELYLLLQRARRRGHMHP